MNDTTHDYAKQGDGWANQTADKAQSGIDEAASNLSGKVESARKSAKPLIDGAANSAGQIRDTAAQASDSIISYTQDNPLKALLFAAAGGALLVSVIKALTPSRG